VQRLYYPKSLHNGSYYVIAWPKAIYLFLKHLFFQGHNSIQVVCSHFLDLSTALMVKNFFNSFGCSNIFYDALFYEKTDFRSFYFLGSSLLALESSSFFLFIGLNLRLEAPLLNARLRKNYVNNLVETSYYSLGFALDYLTFPVQNLGNSASSLLRLLEGKFAFYSKFTQFSLRNFSHFFSIQLKAFLKPLILIGSTIFHRKDSNSIAFSLFSLTNNVFFHDFAIYFISDFLGKLSFFDINCQGRLSKYKTIYSSFTLLLGVHSSLYRPNYEKSFTVFQGSYKNYIAYTPNLLLPVKSQGEQVSFFFNLNGY